MITHLTYVVFLLLFYTLAAEEQQSCIKKPSTPKNYALSPKKAQKQELSCSIIVVSKISADAVKYQKYFCTYAPRNFDIWVNDKKLIYNQPTTILTAERNITVEYTYIWDIIPLYAKKNGKKATFELPDATNSFEIQFNSWDALERITIPGAKRLSAEITTEYHD